MTIAAVKRSLKKKVATAAMKFGHARSRPKGVVLSTLSCPFELCKTTLLAVRRTMISTIASLGVLLTLFWIPCVDASTPDVIVRITPKQPLTTTTTTTTTATESSSVIDIFTNRAQFGSRDDVSGILVHSPLADIFLCEMLRNGGTAGPSSPPTVDLIMLVPRGYCPFQEKARVAQQVYGAKGVLVYDRVASRYHWDNETQRVIFPQPQLDFECNNGEGVVQNLNLDPPAYNGTELDPMLDIQRTDTNICNLMAQDGRTCDSQLCLVTSHQENSTSFPVCCAWDLPFAMPASDESKTRRTDDIVAAFLTIRQAEQVVRTDLLGSQVTIESRSKFFSASYIFMWLLGTTVTVSASWYAAGEHRRFAIKLKAMDANDRARRNNGVQRRSTRQTEGQTMPVDGNEGSHDVENGGHATNDQLQGPLPIDVVGLERTTTVSPLSNEQRRATHQQSVPRQVSALRSLPSPERRRGNPVSRIASLTQARQSQSRAPGTLPSFEMTYLHVVIFIVVASLLLVLLFLFQFYNLIFVLYGIGCAGSISYLIFNPLVVWLIPKFGYHLVRKFNTPILFSYNGFDVLSQSIAYLWGSLWVWYGITHFKPQRNAFFWITADVFGACFCTLMMSLLRLNSIKIATLLMIAVFLYDIFFVFLTPYITGGDSIMLRVAAGGSDGEAFCYKYPEDKSCTGISFIPMLFILPKINDPLNGSVVLGLGDIVLPGFLVAFCARHDEATRLVSSNTPALRIKAPNKWYEGFFFPISVAYAAGLMLAFVAVLLMKQGQPALLYICPILLGTITYLGRNDLKQLWNGAPIFGIAESLIARNERLWERNGTNQVDTRSSGIHPVVSSTTTAEISSTSTNIGNEGNAQDELPVVTPETHSVACHDSQPNNLVDVYFRDQSHPGTQEFVRAVYDATINFSGEDYSPKIHKKIRADLRGRQFFQQDPSTQQWVVADKFEIRQEIGLAYDECRGKRSPFFDRTSR